MLAVEVFNSGQPSALMLLLTILSLFLIKASHGYSEEYNDYEGTDVILEDRSTPRPDHGGIWNELAEGLKSHSVHDMANSWTNEAKLNMQIQALRDALEGILRKLYHYINSTEMPLYF